VTLFVVALAGGLGAVARLVVDGEIRRRVGDGFPWGTAVINLTGSLLLGLVTGLFLGGLLPEPARVVIGTGFLGGYTTFSTAAVETVRLAEQRRYGQALAHGLGQLAAAVLLSAVGLVSGLALAG
jgi:CrcB protein